MQLEVEETSSSDFKLSKKIDDSALSNSASSGNGRLAKATWKTDFSIESLLRKPGRQLANEQNGDTEGKYSDDEDLPQRVPYCNTEINGDFESDQESSSPEPMNPMLGQSNPRYFGITEEDLTAFPWLSCTRFKPPKLPRTRKRVGCKRYGRGPRIPFAPHQIAVLESTFSKSQYLSSDCIHSLADTLHLSETRVKIWFQNRRARYRREREATASALMHGSSNGDEPAHFHSRYHAQQHQHPMSHGHPAEHLHGQPLDLCRTLDQKTFEYFMSSSASPEQTGADKRKLLFPDLIAQQLQRYREVQEYILHQEQRHLGLLKPEAQGFANQPMYLSPSQGKPHSSILQSVLLSSPAMQLPFQTKSISSQSSANSESQQQETSDGRSSHHQFVQFDSNYPTASSQQPFQNFSVQFK